MPRGIVNQIPFLVGGKILLNPGFGQAPAPQHTWEGFNGQHRMGLDGRLGYLNQGAGTSLLESSCCAMSATALQVNRDETESSSRS